MLYRLRYLILFLGGLLWFSIFQPWGRFLDPDAFYHGKMAALMLAGGPVKNFPWLDLTTLGQTFADQHFLFHVILMPFVRLWGIFYGTQIAAVVLCAVCAVVFAWIVERLRLRHAWVWIALGLTSSPWIFRLSLAKASPVAVALFLLGLFAILRRNWWLGALTGFLFALSHGGWEIMLGAQGLLVFGQFVTAAYLDNQRWLKALRSSAWFALGTTLIGVAAGLLVHPNFPNIVSLLWVQIVQIGLLTPFNHVNLGREWLPIDLGTLVFGLGPLFVVALAGVYGLIFERREPWVKADLLQAAAFAFPFAGIFTLAIKSSRMTEYLVPVFALWLGMLWNLIDEKKFWLAIQRHWAELKKSLPRDTVRPILALYVGLLVVMVIHDLISCFLNLRKEARSFNEYQGVTEALGRQADPMERVFNTRWDDFPELFAWYDRGRYIAGLDPTFLYVVNPKLSDEAKSIVRMDTAEQVYDTVKNDFQSRFIVTTKDDPVYFWNLLDKDARFELVYANPDIRLYQLH